MRKLWARTQADEEVNVTPMMDVVFIILIFFIVTTSFVKETGIGISRTSQTSLPTDTSCSSCLAVASSAVDKAAANANSLPSTSS